MRLTALFLIVLALTACAFSTEQARMFERSTLAYERALRWGDFNKALAFHQGRDDPLGEQERQRLKQIRMTSYDTIYAQRVAENEIEQIVEVKYYLEDQVVERSMSLKQVWHYDKDKQAWYLSSPFPAF